MTSLPRRTAPPSDAAPVQRSVGQPVRADKGSLLRLLSRNPALSFTVVVGIILAAVLFHEGSDLRASAYGCVDREYGARQAERIEKDRDAALALGASGLATVRAREAERQQKRNAEAERRCGQSGMPFDLAMRRIDAKRDFLNFVATVAFGFCTLGSVLIVVALREDETEERQLAATGRDAEGVGGGAPESFLDHDSPCLSPTGTIPSPATESDPPGRVGLIERASGARRVAAWAATILLLGKVLQIRARRGPPRGGA